MNYLAIDTSGKNLTILICKDGKTNYYFDSECGVNHSVNLMPKLEELCKQNDFDLKDADFFSAVVGAGSFTGIRIGEVAIVGIPGEPFLGIGRGIKAAEGYGLIIPVACANGYEGYFPMRDSYDEGGYEARSSNFRAGVAEFIIKEGTELLSEM